MGNSTTSPSSKWSVQGVSAFSIRRVTRSHWKRALSLVVNADTTWTDHFEEGEVVEFPIAHGEGRYEIDDDRLDELEAEDRVLFRYCDEDGEVTSEANPNGSKHSVAGVLGERDSVAVLMPHPERVSLPDIGHTDGQGVLRAFGE